MFSKTLAKVCLFFGLGLLLGTGLVMGNHAWTCQGNTAYHWQTPDVKYRNRARGYYKTAYTNSVNLWDTTIINLSGGNGLTLYSGNYGLNGWLGLASISVSGCTITSATCYLNNSYLQSYSNTAIDHVACQEVGHTFGLDHNRSANDTCMNDTILIGNVINQHDYDQLDAIY